MIVVDPALVAAYWLPGDHQATAEAVWRRDGAWNAPLGWRSEVVGSIDSWIALGLLASGERRIVLYGAEAQLAGREHLVAGEEVLERAAVTGRPLRDAELAVLAQTLAVPLVTLDPRLREGFPDVAVLAPEWLSSDRPDRGDDREPLPRAA